MSLWLKKQQPIQLYQSSDIPYIILNEGVHLNYDNCYGTQPDRSEFNLSFRISKSALKRINTYFYKFSTFPAIIPFENIISLNDTIIEGKTIKIAQETHGDPKTVVVMKSSYIRNTDSSDLSNINDILEQCDKSFILVGENIDPQTRLFDGIASIIPHAEWARTLVSIAHNLCENNDRKYCWSKSLPELSLNFYGINNSEIRKIHEVREMIGIDASIEWSD